MLQLLNYGTKERRELGCGKDNSYPPGVNHQSYPLNTFRKSDDTTIKLAIHSDSALKCGKNTEDKTYNPPKNECSIIIDTNLCNANPKCEYDNDTTKCNYKKTNITDLLNYSILKIYK